jgi:hypothetical protein
LQFRRSANLKPSVGAARTCKPATDFSAKILLLTSNFDKSYITRFAAENYETSDETKIIMLASDSNKPHLKQSFREKLLTIWMQLCPKCFLHKNCVQPITSKIPTDLNSCPKIMKLIPKQPEFCYLTTESSGIAIRVTRREQLPY